jgi:hypothetical protein
VGGAASGVLAVLKSIEVLPSNSIEEQGEETTTVVLQLGKKRCRRLWSF